MQPSWEVSIPAKKLISDESKKNTELTNRHKVEITVIHLLLRLECTFNIHSIKYKKVRVIAYSGGNDVLRGSHHFCDF